MSAKKIKCGDIPDCLIDLHLHLDGSLSPASARRLAAMQSIAIPEDDAELQGLLSVSDGCRDLNEYLEKFDFPCSLLQTPESISEAVYTLAEELRAQGLIYAEIRFAPQKHCLRSMTQEDAVLAAIDGMSRSDLPCGLILCCMRGDDNHADNMETIALAAKYRGMGVCAADLAGAEALYKTECFADLFRHAAALGVRFTIHAGEADGADSIRCALDLGAERIGHGVRCIEDKALMRRLADSGTPLELCPTSNLNTAVFPDLAHYPLPELMDAGVCVTINTDNTSVSATSVRREYRALIDAFDLTRDQVRGLLLNAARAAFCDDATRASLADTINARFDEAED